jgi:eukaryotic-like serine/threonine-protein kinase
MGMQAPSIVGQVLDGRYKILRKLGEGGMGEVYAAEHVHIEKRFAIKLLRSEILSNPEAVSRFRQEARSSSSIGHRNIIAIEDFGTLTDGRVYMCMELLNGAALNDLITTPQPVDRLLNILIQTGHGLAAAHAKNIVHRDMKPENIFVTVGPQNEDIPKLLDFGIAKVAGNDGQNNLTRTGTIFGTPFYMAPEQALGNPVDARTDIYAVGVIMYEVFAGSLPFQGESFMGILTQHITTEPENVQARASKGGRILPPGLAEIITRCMQKNPAQRFSTMDELVGALVQIYRGVAGPGMSTYMEAFPQPNPTSNRMPVPTPGPMSAQLPHAAPTMGVATPSAPMPQYQHGHASPSQPHAMYPSHSQPFDPSTAGSSGVKKSSSTGLIIAILALLLVGGGGAAAFLLLGGGKSDGGSPADAQVAEAKTPDAAAAGDVTPPPVTPDAATAVTPVTPDAASEPPPITPDAATIPKIEGVEVQIYLKNGGAFEAFEDGSKIFTGPDRITITPGQPRTIVLKAPGFKDRTVTIDGKLPRLEIRLERVHVTPPPCPATPCASGQVCEAGKCKAPTTPPRLDCSNAILQPRNKDCVAQYCARHAAEPICIAE